MLRIYFSFSVQCKLTLLLQLSQTQTDSSYRLSVKIKYRPERKNSRTNLQNIQRNSEGPLQLRRCFLFPLVSLIRCNTVFCLFHFRIFLYIFLYPI